MILLNLKLNSRIRLVLPMLILGTVFTFKPLYASPNKDNKKTQPTLKKSQVPISSENKIPNNMIEERIYHLNSPLIFLKALTTDSVFFSSKVKEKLNLFNGSIEKYYWNGMIELPFGQQKNALKNTADTQTPAQSPFDFKISDLIKYISFTQPFSTAMAKKETSSTLGLVALQEKMDRKNPLYDSFYYISTQYCLGRVFVNSESMMKNQDLSQTLIFGTTVAEKAVNKLKTATLLKNVNLKTLRAQIIKNTGASVYSRFDLVTTEFDNVSNNSNFTPVQVQFICEDEPYSENIENDFDMKLSYRRIIKPIWLDNLQKNFDIYSQALLKEVPDQAAKKEVKSTPKLKWLKEFMLKHFKDQL